jgi:hypothetical protein
MDSLICRLTLLTMIVSFIGAIVWLLLLVIQSALQNHLERYRTCNHCTENPHYGDGQMAERRFPSTGKKQNLKK